MYGYISGEIKEIEPSYVIIDNNGLQIDGNIEEVCSPYPIDEKFKSFNFHVINIDAHNFDEIKMAFDLCTIIMSW